MSEEKEKEEECTCDHWTNSPWKVVSVSIMLCAALGVLVAAAALTQKRVLEQTFSGGLPEDVVELLTVDADDAITPVPPIMKDGKLRVPVLPLMRVEALDSHERVIEVLRELVKQAKD